jgi:hypothetical protein
VVTAAGNGVAGAGKGAGTSYVNRYPFLSASVIDVALKIWLTSA